MVIFLFLVAGTLCFGAGEGADSTAAGSEAVSPEAAPAAGSEAVISETAPAANDTDKVRAPLTVVPQPVHEFEPVLEGDGVVHNFVIENKGNAELQIERVQTG